jgi:phage baseplate assembly protein W
VNSPETAVADFLGSGWRFPPRLDSRGGVALSALEHKVRESIWIILGTAKGERMMRPDFGCDIHEFVFAPIDSTTVALIRDAIEEALVLWEPRIDVLSVEAATEGRQAPVREAMLPITVRYRIRSTNTEYNLVYPFYLRRGG